MCRGSCILVRDRSSEVVGTGLLAATIEAGDGHVYKLTLHPQSAPIDEGIYLRFALHYYARVLYELSQSEHGVPDLPDLVDRIAQTPLSMSTDVFEIAGVVGQLTAAIAHPIGFAELSFRRSGLREFDLAGEIHMTGRTLAYSVLALVQYLLTLASADNRAALMTALANMNASYALTHRHASANSLHEVPAVAFLAAAFAQG